MAHGRTGPDIVMNIRYAGASEVRAVSVHETKRTPDGASAIDPSRSELNQVLEGPATQTEALAAMWAQGVKPPAAQAERPYVQMVLSASPEYFRGPGQGPGQWDESRLKAWKAATLGWLRDEYGDDLAHASLHLDEDTPHIHALVVPTYEKRPRKPGKPKRGETAEEFEARKREALNAPTVRAVGRSSCEKWARNYARRYARKSYHAAVERLGLGYGRDFVDEGKPGPEHKTTGEWVREQAAEVAQEKARVAVVIQEAEAKAAVLVQDAEAVAATVIQEAEATAAEAEARRIEAAEEALRVSTKAGALLTATAALTAEMTAGTIRRTDAGKIIVRDAAALKGGLPDLKPAINAAADAAEARHREEQAAEAARASRAAEDAAAEAARVKAAQILQEAQADRAAAAADRKTAGRLIERLNGLLDQAGTFLRMPGLSKAVRDAGAALFTAAGRAVPEPEAATSHGGGGSRMRRMAGLDAAPPSSAPAAQPRPEARNPAPLSVDRSDDFSL